MKVGIAMLYAAVSTLIVGSATAQQRQTDDVRWVNQCVRDSASYSVSEQVKIMYCTCMVSKMSNNETRSVTQWEQANPAARDDCARRAGWN
jgi:hypothetical protein